MADPRRVEKVNILLGEMIADLLSRLLQFPEGVLVTVTRVAASPDLHSANVFVSVLAGAGNEAAEPAVLQELRHAARLIQVELNRRLRMRPVPRIRFAIDAGEKRRERVEQLLNEEQ